MRVLIVFSIFVLSIFSFAACENAPAIQADSSEIVKTPGVSEISPQEALPAVEAAYAQFIDVRTPEEFAEGHANRARNIPLDTLMANLDKLEKNEPVYLICRSGSRSKKAAQILVDNGFPQAISIAGGTEAWKSAGLPMGDDAPPPVTSRVDEKTRQALIAALEDERRAQATDQAVLDSFDGARPFVNIIEAERRHESFLVPLFKKYGVEIPKGEFDPAKMPAPASLKEACEAGIAAEKANIALYDDFLKFVKEPDIRQTFELLRSASQDNHLPAFTRCSEGGPGGGRGRGRPF
ncbi:MAG: rhodanese-like domain-containing protein [Pyrinomonadaceae bacterium]